MTPVLYQSLATHDTCVPSVNTMTLVHDTHHMSLHVHNRLLPRPGRKHSRNSHRFRSANAALEAENAALKKRETSMELDTRTLRSDNVKMYEKIKFLESYRPSASSHGHAVYILSPRFSPSGGSPCAGGSAGAACAAGAVIRVLLCILP